MATAGHDAGPSQGIRHMEVRINYRAVSPQGHQAFGRVSEYISGCGLDPMLLNLLLLRVSQINGCAFCVDLHYRDCVKNGVGERKLSNLVTWRESPLFSERERAALGWAESVTMVAETGAPQHEYEAVKAHFSDKEVVDLTYAIALMNAMNRVAIGFRRRPELSAQERAAAGLQ